jgi:tetratricopeptide (TPR) repeat protein
MDPRERENDWHEPETMGGSGIAVWALPPSILLAYAAAAPSALARLADIFIRESAMSSRAFSKIACWSLGLLLARGGWAQTQSNETSDLNPRAGKDSRAEQIFFSGNVVQENGALPVGASIELDCSGLVTREATVESNGHFWFPLGDSSRFGKEFQNAGQDVADPFIRDSGMAPYDLGSVVTARVQKMSMDPKKLLGCTLRASLSGYRSSTIELGAAPLSLHNDVGTIVLFPMEKVRGTTVSAVSLLAPKSAKKEMGKAAAALRKGKTGDSEKYLKSAIDLYPKYAEAWFQLGRLYQAQRRTKEARDAYMKAIESDRFYVNPYVWFAQVSAAEQKWQDAADFTQQALGLDPAAFPEAYYLNALANFNLKNLILAETSARQAERLDSTHRFSKLHLILASICLGKNDIVLSIDELRKYLKYGPRGALALPKSGSVPFLGPAWETASEFQKKEMVSSAGLEVRLMLAEAFWGAGMVDQAKAELATYTENRDGATIPPQVRGFLEQIQRQGKNETAIPEPKEETETRGEKPIDYLHYPVQDLPDFEPARDQAPIDGILSSVGNNVSRLFADLLNVSAVEGVQLEKFDRNGKTDPRRFEYLYLCIGAIKKEDLIFNEYRSDERGSPLSQLGLEDGYMLTAGFVSAPLIFHPAHQDESSFRLLGYQKVRGRNTIAIAYAQLPARSRLPGNFQSGINRYETFKQGLAWVDAENYNIIRLVSELLQPIPQIGLEKLGTQIDFDEVWFSQAEQKFWLPVQVVVTVRWNGKVLRNTHAYSDFKLFDVKTSQKIEKPEPAGKNIDRAADPPAVEKGIANPSLSPVPPVE